MQNYECILLHFLFLSVVEILKISASLRKLNWNIEIWKSFIFLHVWLEIFGQYQAFVWQKGWAWFEIFTRLSTRINY